MKRLFLYCIFLIVIVFAGIEVVNHPGYVVFYIRHFEITIRLWTFVIVLLLLLILLNIIWRVCYALFSQHGRLQVWYHQRSINKSHSKTGEGLLALTQGNWSKAENLLIKNVRSSHMPLINYLAAACAAQQQGKQKQSEKYLRYAYKKAPKEEIAIGLTQAQLQLYTKQFEQALATLKHLRQLSPKHEYVLLLLKRIYQHFNDWNSLIELLPKLQKHKVIDHQEQRDLLIQCYSEKLKAKKLDLGELKKIWSDMPNKLHQEPGILTIYAQQLLCHNQDDETVDLIYNYTKKNWDEKLIRLFDRAQHSNSEKHFKQAEQLLKQHGHSPLLLLVAGKLAARCKLWGIAKEMLQESISKKPSAQAYAQLGLVEQQLGDKEQACVAYQTGAVLMEQR